MLEGAVIKCWEGVAVQGRDSAESLRCFRATCTMLVLIPIFKPRVRLAVRVILFSFLFSYVLWIYPRDQVELWMSHW